jgi:hypothetical protein
METQLTNEVINDPFYQGDLALIPRRLSSRLGFSAAVLLSELHADIKHDLGSVHEGRMWIGRSAAAWGKAIDFSGRSIARITKSMLELGIISVEKLAPHKGNRTNYLTINYDALNFVLQQPHNLVRGKPSSYTINYDALDLAEKERPAKQLLECGCEHEH